MDDCQEYIKVIQTIRSLGYSVNQTTCGISMLVDGQPFDPQKIVDQVIANIKLCDKLFMDISTQAKKATYENAGVTIHRVIRWLTDFIELYPDLNMCEIVSHVINIIADPDVNDFKKCFLVWQAIELDYFHKLAIKKFN